MSFVDEQIGRVLRKLEETGLDQNTVVVITSDHGYHLGEHGHWQKETLFQNATQVPLLMHDPSSTQSGSMNDVPVELIDIYPTLMELTGITPPSFLAGQNLVSMLTSTSMNQSTLIHCIITRLRSGEVAIPLLTAVTGLQGGMTRMRWNGNFMTVRQISRNAQLSFRRTAPHPFDSLRLILESRVVEAQQKPRGLGRQFANAQPAHKAPNITPGDQFDEQGRQTCMNQNKTEECRGERRK